MAKKPSEAVSEREDLLNLRKIRWLKHAMDPEKFRPRDEGDIHCFAEKGCPGFLTAHVRVPFKESIGFRLGYRPYDAMGNCWMPILPPMQGGKIIIKKAALAFLRSFEPSVRPKEKK
ncbi:MAG: hypothetical protein AAB364_00485 [Patescibacteria group bacterium]